VDAPQTLLFRLEVTDREIDDDFFELGQFEVQRQNVKRDRVNMITASQCDIAIAIDRSAVYVFQ
jgi:hypothetical protein